MKILKYIIVFLLVFISCKSKKQLTDESSKIKTVSAKKIVKKHITKNFNKNTVDAKLKVGFKNEKQEVGFSVRMKMKKDEVIWLKGTKLITVFKAKITPEKISFYSPYYKNYIEGDFKMLEKILGVSVNFQQLQSLLLGQALLETSQKHTVQFTNNTYKLAPKKQSDAFDVFYWINTEHYKLDKQAFVNSLEEKRLDIVYPSYKKTDNMLFPEMIKIQGKAKNKYSDIDLLVKSIIFNEEISIPFLIPEGYKEIKI